MPKGYVGFSRSVRAAQAEGEGLYPASVAAKLLGVSAAAIREFLCSDEWHHTSKYYNATDYYDVGFLLDYMDGETEGWSAEDLQEAKELLEQMKAFRAPKVERKMFRANVNFILWGGSRNHPKAYPYSYENIVVQQNGKRFTFYLPDGSTVVKMEGSNGTEVFPQQATELAVKRQFNKWKREHGN